MSFSCSRPFNTLRATDDELRSKWLGLEPRRLRPVEQQQAACLACFLLFKQIYAKHNSDQTFTFNVLSIPFPCASAKRVSWFQAFLAETMVTGDKNCTMTGAMHVL